MLNSYLEINLHNLQATMSLGLFWVGIGKKLQKKAIINNAIVI